MNVKTRKAQTIDSQKVFELFEEYAKEYPSNYPESRHNYEVWNETYSDMIDNKNVSVYLAEVDEDIVGVLTSYVLPRLELGGNYSVVEDIYVLSTYRRNGIGTALVNESFSELKEVKAHSCDITAHKDNEGALKFCESLGFVPSDVGYSKILF